MRARTDSSPSNLNRPCRAHRPADGLDCAGRPTPRGIRCRGLAVRTTLNRAALLSVTCLLINISSLDVCAQSASTGALTGTVTDPSGAVLQNAQIMVRNVGTDEGRAAIADRDESYRISTGAGEYELTMEAAGFAPVVQGCGPVIRRIFGVADNIHNRFLTVQKAGVLLSNLLLAGDSLVEMEGKAESTWGSAEPLSAALAFT
jgi:Carboxypeptidase regulatory-like domain